MGAIHTTRPALTAGTVLRRPDGVFVILESRLDRDTWGCDQLEDLKGFPDPLGDPVCAGLRISMAELLTYDRVTPSPR